MNNSFVDSVTNEEKKREEAARIAKQQEMQIYAQQYKQRHPKATTRVIKRAVKKKFCIIIEDEI